MGKQATDIVARITDKGARLREVRRDLLRQKPGATQRWFQGPDGCDLFLWYDGRMGLSQIQLTIEQRAIEWGLETGIKTARLHAFNPLTPGSDRGRLVYDKEPDVETLGFGRALLHQAPIDDVTLALVRQKLGFRKAS